MKNTRGNDRLLRQKGVKLMNLQRKSVPRQFSKCLEKTIIKEKQGHRQREYTYHE